MELSLALPLARPGRAAPQLQLQLQCWPPCGATPADRLRIRVSPPFAHRWFPPLPRAAAPTASTWALPTNPPATGCSPGNTTTRLVLAGERFQYRLITATGGFNAQRTLCNGNIYGQGGGRIWVPRSLFQASAGGGGVVVVAGERLGYPASRCQPCHPRDMAAA
jgi:hypothetical protein